MKCSDFRSAADDRPDGTAARSPRLGSHLDACPACARWESDRRIWGDLGSLFRKEDREAERFARDAALMLRARVRQAIPEPRSAGRIWLRPLAGTLAAAALAVAVLVGPVRSHLSLDAPVRDSRESLGTAETGGNAPRPGGEPETAVKAGSHTIEPEGHEIATAENFGPVRPDETTREMTNSEPEGLAAPAAGQDESTVRVVKVGQEIAVLWPSNGNSVHRIVKSTNPADFSSGSEVLVRGDSWVDDSPASAAGVQFYRID